MDLTYITDRFDAIEQSIQANSIGIQNVYNEFIKNGGSELMEAIKRINERLDHYEKDKNVEEFNIDVSSFPLNILVKIKIKTNFGSISYAFDYPPSCEYNISGSISRAYRSLLNDLYDEHENRGGKFLGEMGFGEYIKEHGETIIDKPQTLLHKR